MFQIFTLLILVNIASVRPAKLLRVPKIYNALITSREKILPSEAYPASTGPIFQPIGLPGQTIVIPGVFYEQVKGSENGDSVRPPGSTKKFKTPIPVTFYPRYSLYYAHQPYLTLQQTLFYSPAQSSPQHESQIPPEKKLSFEEHSNLSYQKPKIESTENLPEFPAPKEYVKNNRPADRNIPDIPPPPPPVRFRGNIDEDDSR